MINAKKLNIKERDLLLDLVEKWFEAPGQIFSLSKFNQIHQKVTELPAKVIPLISQQDKYHLQAMQDALTYHQVGKLMTGIGTEYLINNDIYMTPEKLITNLEIKVQWSRDMSGTELDYYSTSLEKIIWEDQSWKIAQVWSKHDRKLFKDMVQV
jgi:hypothetical protein